MSGEKYIGLDVHQATISVAVVDSRGKVVMESILETKASTILEFLAGLRGSLFVTFEETRSNSQQAVLPLRCCHFHTSGLSVVRDSGEGRENRHLDDTSQQSISAATQYW